MAGKDILKISANVDIADLSLENLKISLEVGNVATAKVTALRTGKTVRKMLTSDILKDIRASQQKRLQGVDEPDINITAKDGKGGNIKFKGYIAAPILDISSSHYQMAFSAVGVDAMLNGLDLSIYSAASGSTRPGESPSGLSRLPSAKSGNLPQLMLQITEVLLSNKEITEAHITNKDMKLLLEHQHTINMGNPIKVWKAVLGGSDVKFESWDAMLSLNVGMGTQLAKRVADILKQPTSGFWAAFSSIMASFSMFYKPNTAGNGSMHRLDKKMLKPEKSVDLHAMRMGVADGSSYILQVGGVVMIAAGRKSLRDEKSGVTGIAGQWPQPLLSGYIHQEMPPIWMLDPLTGVPYIGSSMDKKADALTDGKDLSLDGYKDRISQGDKHDEKVGDAHSSVMTELCKIMFKNLQLADSSVSATCQLDFSIECGNRCTFNLADGGSFTGFLQSVTHSLDLVEGRQMDSYTQLYITHVEY